MVLTPAGPTPPPRVVDRSSRHAPARAAEATAVAGVGKPLAEGEVVVASGAVVQSEHSVAGDASAGPARRVKGTAPLGFPVGVPVVSRRSPRRVLRVWKGPALGAARAVVRRPGGLLLVPVPHSEFPGSSCPEVPASRPVGKKTPATDPTGRNKSRATKI